MTGSTLCRKLCPSCAVECAMANGYRPGDRTITLTPAHYGGTTAQNLTVAAHECGHAQQHADVGWLVPALGWVCLGRLLLEWDASRRAQCLLAREGLITDDGTLRASWHGYLWPAVWQTGFMVTIIWAGVILRR